jgi:hypothetical protein
MKSISEIASFRSIVAFSRIGGLTGLLLVTSLSGFAQTPKGKGDKTPSSAGDKAAPGIPTFRVTSRLTESAALAGTPARKVATSGAGPLVAPPALTPDSRTRLLRESGIAVGPVSAPAEFRLSPQRPYVSSSAYLFFNSALEFNAADDSLVMRAVATRLDIPDWTGAGTRVQNPSILGVLIRMDPGSRYIADFSLSSDHTTTYEISVTGAEGTGTFLRERGAHHVFALLQSTAGGYARLNLWGRATAFGAELPLKFTFHNVVVTKLD